MRIKLYRGKWYAVQQIDGKTIRTSLRTDNRDAALRRLADATKEKRGETVGEIVEAYIRDKKDKRSSGSMATAYRSLAGFFGHLRPDQVDRAICKSYHERRVHSGGVSAGTVIKDLGVLRAAIRWSGQGGKATFWFPPTPAPRDLHITREQAQALADAASLPHIRLFIILAWSTGGRHGALLDLTWDRVDFGRRLIRLARKATHGHKGRAVVPMTGWAETALQEAHKARTSEYVIEYAGKPLRSIKRGFEWARERAGLPEGVTPHVMRHSAAVAMAEAGIPMAEIGQFLGHTDLKVTYRVYGRFSPDYLRKAAKALE